MMNQKNIMVCLMSLIAIVLAVVAIVTTNWTKLEVTGPDGKQNFEFGLWKGCLVNGKKNCSDILSSDNPPNFPKNSVKACRGLMIAGVSLIFMSMVACLVDHWMISHMMMCGMLGLGSVLVMISVIVWAMELRDPKIFPIETGKLSWSWALALVSSVVGLLGTMVCIF